MSRVGIGIPTPSPPGGGATPPEEGTQNGRSVTFAVSRIREMEGTGESAWSPATELDLGKLRLSPDS